jgi:glucose-6-phosphate 1-epimerase
MLSIPNLPGVREGTFHGMPALLIETPLCTCAVSLFGAQVLSFVPRGQGDLLWMSPTTKAPPSAIRGGIPLCWPHFAKQGQPDTATQHGFARTSQWRVTQARAHENGEIELSFALEPSEATPLALMSLLRVGATLHQTLTTTNPTAQTHRITQAFHTYFRVGDAREIYVTGLAGLSYLSKFDDFAEFTQVGEFRLETQSQVRSDRIYQGAGGRYALVDAVLKRRIEIASHGSSTLVVWNPGAEAIKSFTDIPHHAWLDYFCLEVANAGREVVTLAPGAAAQLSQTIWAAPL